MPTRKFFQSITSRGLITLVLVLLFLSSVSGFILVRSSAQNAPQSTTFAFSFYPNVNSDIANQENGKLVFPNSQNYIGSSNDVNALLGIRFSNPQPNVNTQNMYLESAVVEFTSIGDQWIGLSNNVYLENNLNPQTFSNTNKISTQPLTSSKTTYSNDVKWLKNNKYIIDVTHQMKEILAQGPQTKNFAVIIKNAAKGPWARKFFYNDVNNKNNVPRLILTFTIQGQPNPPPTPTPTPSPTPTPTPVPPPATGNADSFGVWKPTKWDTCPASLHDSFYVIGPDGLKYPTWHPTTMIDPATGKTCTFGHEHGDDPSKSPLWHDIQQMFYYDANHNGKMDPEEQKVTGIPFGYANQQFGIYYSTQNSDTERHEDDTGHKISYGNFAVTLPSPNGQIKTSTTCDYFAEVHQGTFSKDAFENNVHEVIYAARCSDGAEVILTQMARFGRAGEFTGFCDVNGKRTTNKISTGFSYSNPNYLGVPDDQGQRMILTRDCINQVFLVPSNKFSANFYEAWPVSLNLRGANGNSIVSNINLLFDVENTGRFYDPGKPDNLGHSVDLCYETEANGDKMHGSSCDQITNYGKIQGVTWDDPRSTFNGTSRGTYFFPPTINNANGSTTWYSDPYGMNASTTPKAGYIKQFVSVGNVNYSQQFHSNIDPTVLNKVYSNGGGTVHAPN